MISNVSAGPIGLLLSGGLDSTILLGYLIECGARVHPVHVRTDFVWQQQELRAAERVVAAFASQKATARRVAPLVVLEMPLADLYQNHWSVTGELTPDHHSGDDAVYLPGHNALLLIKAALWCRMRNIGRLALACLSSNPFADATPSFFDPFQAAISHATGGNLEILRPFEWFTKRDVMHIGRHYALELTFSCLSPSDGFHCGRCNKCAERQAAFRWIDSGDPTCYANGSQGAKSSGS
jgi:7-cyano-7-deazaguanine synthase